MKPLFPYRPCSTVLGAGVVPLELALFAVARQTGMYQRSALVMAATAFFILDMALGLWLQVRWVGIAFVFLATAVGVAYDFVAVRETTGFVLIINIGISLAFYTPLVFACKTSLR